MRLWIYFLAAAVALTGTPLEVAATNETFVVRGYYTTFMRMPTFGLPEWKQMIDCMKDDGANFLILWTAGAYRSKRFPITWKYNAEHKNVEHDAVFRLALGTEIFGAHAREPQVNDLLFLQDCWFTGADWFTPALFLRPMELKRRAEREKWSGEKMQSYLFRVERLREMAKQYVSSDLASEREMARIAALVVRKWEDFK